MPDGLAPGSTFARSFVIEAVAGQGGMGIVYRARQIVLDRTVALKVISPAVADRLDFHARFEREARLAASIDHPNCVSIHHAGEHEGQPYLVMQWIEGADLRQLLAREGPLPIERACAIVTQIAHALDAAHARGLLHRDVKSSNVLVRREGDAYLTDFGVAKALADTTDDALTNPGQVVGTVGYMAPEIVIGEPPDGRADLYALGCVLYEALTGRPPFQRDSEMAMLWAHVNEPRPLPGAFRPELSRLDGLLTQAMAIDPRHRFQRGAALAAALAQVAEGASAAPTQQLTPEAAAAGAALGQGPPERPADAQAPQGQAPPQWPAAEQAPQGQAPPQWPAAEQAPQGQAPPTMLQPQSGPPPPPYPPRRPPRRSNSRTRWIVGSSLAFAVLLCGGVGLALALDKDDDKKDDPQSTLAQPTPTPSPAPSPSPSPSPSPEPSPSPGGLTRPSDPEVDRQDVLNVLRSYQERYTARDAEGLGVLMQPDVTRFGLDGRSCRLRRGRSAVVSSYRSQFAGGTGSYRFVGLDSDAALISGDDARITQRYRITPGGSGRVSFALERVPGQDWKISRISASC